MEARSSASFPVQRQIFFRQNSQDTTKPTLEQIQNWLKSASYAIPEDSKAGRRLKAMFEDGKSYTYDWAYGQKQLVDYLENKHEDWLAEARQSLFQSQSQLLPLMFHISGWRQTRAQHH